MRKFKPIGKRMNEVESDLVSKGVPLGSAHTHSAGDGAKICEESFSFSDRELANADSTKHGLLPRLPDDAEKFLRGDGTWTTGGAGEPGPQGLKGDKGDKGDTGEKGSDGAQGIAGSMGDTGAQGIQGVQGSTGSDGAKGDTGDTGAQGNQGIQGIQGIQGEQGAQGAPGTPGPTQSQILARGLGA